MVQFESTAKVMEHLAGPPAIPLTYRHHSRSDRQLSELLWLVSKADRKCTRRDDRRN
jgi:hypothetical protein